MKICAHSIPSKLRPFEFAGVALPAAAPTRAQIVEVAGYVSLPASLIFRDLYKWDPGECGRAAQSRTRAAKAKEN
jgi:hypothetical protein